MQHRVLTLLFALNLKRSKSGQACRPIRICSLSVLHKKTFIHNNEVEIVSKYKYLGTVFDDKLKWDDNTEEIVKKGQQQLYQLRKLNYFSVEQKILTLFYKSFIESVLSFSFICWFNSQLGSEEQEQPAKSCP